MATLNVRMSGDLKEAGDQVLREHGLSVSEAVRDLYEYLQEEQSLPPFLAVKEDRLTEKTRKRRELLPAVIGCVSSDVDLNELRQEKMAKYL